MASPNVRGWAGWAKHKILSPFLPSSSCSSQRKRKREHGYSSGTSCQSSSHFPFFLLKQTTQQNYTTPTECIAKHDNHGMVVMTWPRQMLGGGAGWAKHKILSPFLPSSSCSSQRKRKREHGYSSGAATNHARTRAIRHSRRAS